MAAARSGKACGRVEERRFGGLPLSEVEWAA